MKGHRSWKGANLNEENKIRQKNEEAEVINIPEVMEVLLEDEIDHAILVSNLASRLARELGNSEEFCKDIALAAVLHDIGKLKLEDYLEGKKKSSLKIEQMKYVRMHSTIGYEILCEKNLYTEEIRDAVHHHHENYDGSGYPSNLKGENIPYMARILRVCDVFAALISERSYRASFDAHTAVELMIDEVKNFDMKVFLGFLSMINATDTKELQEYVALVNEKIKSRRKTSA